MFPFQRKDARGGEAAKTGGTLSTSKTVPLPPLKKALGTLLKHVWQAAAADPGEAALAERVQELRQLLELAFVREDFEELFAGVQDLPLRLRTGESAALSEALERILDAAIGLARLMGQEGPLAALEELLASVTDPSRDVPGELSRHLSEIGQSVRFLQAAAFVFRTSLADVLALLGEVANHAPGSRKRLEAIQQRLAVAREYEDLMDLRTALHQEAGSLLEEVQQRDEELRNAQAHLDEVRSEMGTLQSALTDAAAMARTDALTGLGNRRALAEVLVQCAKSNATIGVLALDLDNFKQINDGFGHDTGDTVIRSLAALLRQELRGHDHAFRVGGEEFIVLLAGTGLSESCAVAERVRELFAALPQGGGEQPFAATVSIGVGAWERGARYEDVSRDVDAALYRAKHEGRNRVVPVSSR